MNELYEKMLKEWERTLLGAMLVICLAGLAWGTFTYLGYLGDDGEKKTPNVTVKEAIHKNAMAFLEDTRAPRMGNNHAMRLQVPRDWIENMENRARIAKRDRDNEQKERDRLRKIALDEQRERLKNQLKNGDPDDPNKVKDPDKKVPPPIKHVIVFKGFMRSPSGEMLAFLGGENVQGDVKVRTGSTFIQNGTQVAGYVVKEVTDEYVVLVGPDGKKETIIRGEKFTIGVTQNPPGFLKEPGGEPQE